MKVATECKPPNVSNHVFKMGYMKKILIILIFITNQSFSQNLLDQQDIYSIKIPKNITECFKTLDVTLGDIDRGMIKRLAEDSIVTHNDFTNGMDFFHAWKIYDGSVLTKYFNKKGLKGSSEIYETILVSYHRYLNKEKIDLPGQILKHQTKQKEDLEYYKSIILKDSINGVYIPKDLKDCFLQLDKLLSSEDRETIKGLKSKDETNDFHHGLGMWLRNSWHLWGGSRLQQYMLKKKVNHPDEMSSIILSFYHDWLNNQNQGWENWMKK